MSVGSFISEWYEGSREYDLLEQLAEKLTEKSPSGKVTYTVGNCYFDFGQGWMWTTVLANRNGYSWQALNPREQQMLFVDGDIDGVVESVFGDKYCPDKIGG